MNSLSVNIERLWAWGREHFGCEDVSDVFGDVGLAPIDEKWTDHWSTPTNAKVFATTGVDGAHYASFVSDCGQANPVVLVVPDSLERSHYIVGETLHEFLSLGCHYGYFLGELAHRPDFMAEELQNFVDEGKGFASQLLSDLRDAFQLAPWDKVSERFEKLQQGYLYQLDIPEL